MAVYVKCPKCKTTWEFSRCGNCESSDGVFKEVMKLGRGEDGEAGVFCKACGMGFTEFTCRCGCRIQGRLFKDSAPFFSKPVKA